MSLNVVRLAVGLPATADASVARLTAPDVHGYTPSSETYPLRVDTTLGTIGGKVRHREGPLVSDDSFVLMRNDTYDDHLGGTITETDLIGVFASFQDAAEALRKDCILQGKDVNAIYKHSHLGEQSAYKKHYKSLMEGEEEALKYFRFRHPEQGDGCNIEVGETLNTWSEVWEWDNFAEVISNTAADEDGDDGRYTEWSIKPLMIIPPKKRFKLAGEDVESESKAADSSDTLRQV